MATLLGANATKRKSDPSSLVDVCEQAGRLRVAYDSFSGDAAQDDIIQMGQLPAGSKIYRAEIKHDALGASVTADIGYTGSPTAIASNYDISAAGDSAFIAPSAKLSEAKDIEILLEGADPASGSIELVVYYSVD